MLTFAFHLLLSQSTLEIRLVSDAFKKIVGRSFFKIYCTISAEVNVHEESLLHSPFC